MKLFLIISSAFLLAGSNPAPAEDAQSLPKGPTAEIPTNAPISNLGKGRFQIGSVTLDKRTQTVEFPAIVNLVETPVEYLLVTQYGKVHESVLRTETQPYEIHLAMLLLGARGKGTNAYPDDTSSPLPGEKLGISIHWQTNRINRQGSGASFIYNRKTSAALINPEWIYTGSMLYEGSFLAQQEGSIVSLINDPVSLVNYPGPLRLEDENWRPFPENMPFLDTMVRVRFILKKAPAKDGNKKEQGAAKQ